MIAIGQSTDAPRVEITAGAWLVHPRGTIQASGTQVDLKSDLALQDQATFAGKISLRLGRKHELHFEGIPYSFSGQNTLTRSIVFKGATYQIQDTISSHADLTYFTAGYQYNFVSRAQGHLGLSADVAYLGASGTITSLIGNVSATESQTIALPLAGADFRVFLLPHRDLLNVSGTAKGMSLGDYGSYVQAGGNFGVRLFKGVSAQAGYLYPHPDIHSRSGSANAVEVAPRFSGPVFSIVFRSRQ